MTKTEFLRKQAIESVHKKARVAMPKQWSTADVKCSLPERKAYALKMIFDEMPIYIGEQELVVGSRTVYGHRNEQSDKSDMEVIVMPEYVSESDVQLFGTNGQFYTKGHYTAGYEKILQIGISGIIKQAKASIEKNTLQDKIDYLNSIIIAYEGLSNLIKRYSDYAAEMAVKESSEDRKNELIRISEVCKNIAINPPKDFHEAVQLFWFSHLSLIIENFIFMNYGRVDQFLYPFIDTVSNEEAQQLIECLLIKMYDGVDVIEGEGPYSAQHNITIGGVKKDGTNAVNELSFIFIRALSKIRFPEPEVSIRINSKNPPEFLDMCSALSVTGLNCMAYYNDDLFIKSMVKAGIPQEDANDYSFDLCQDITIAGRGDFFVSGDVDLTTALLRAMKQSEDTATFSEFIKIYKNEIAADIEDLLTNYNKREKAIREYAKGNKDYLFDKVKSNELPCDVSNPLMSPLPLTSALYDGCIENATDLSWYGCVIEDKGFMISNLVVAINSLAAMHKYVFDEEKYTISEVLTACENNYDGYESMRQVMWNAPKWANDDDYVDLPAKEIIEFACEETLKYKTPNGARHLAGIHQPHPVQGGRMLGATPEGRKNGEPIPVTLSPENGTMLNGPTAAFKSAAKIDPMKYQWNNCVMLQYFSSVFDSNDGAKMFSNLLTSYFAINGTQHQPNIMNVADLKAAQREPEKYKDLIVRMWGISAHFVDLPKDFQEEFIARFENV